MERLFFEAVLNSYQTLAKEIGMCSEQKLRRLDTAVTPPKWPTIIKKIRDLLQTKKEHIEKTIQEIDEMYHL